MASIVTGNHQSAAVFEKYDLDFCCKGKRSLQDACRDKKINPAAVLMDLEKIMQLSDTGSQHMAEKSLSELTSYIVSTHHEYVRRQLPLIHGYLDKVASKHGERHPELYPILENFSAIREEMELHMQKEEKVLFPRIREIENLSNWNQPLSLSSTFISAPVSMMEQEHEHAGALMAEIRTLSNDYNAPGDACTTYKLSFASLQAFEEDLHRHVHLENYLLFPAALQLIRSRIPELE
ncbi:MAG: iron-sulfur cluster repair di-iron protein [Chitinophagaceae bacterium]|nr:iron-sulfur cluster repair di-iron protein [Chitinophagaceae bacterium]